MKAALLTPIACLLIATTPASATPPSAPATTPHPNAGGARLRLGPAYWDRGDDERVEIRGDGAVYEDDELVFRIDTQGRVLDSDRDLYVSLAEEGLVTGPNSDEGGRVGLHNATPGKRRQYQAWLRLTSDGSVTFYDWDGEREAGGQWHGCEGPMLRTCTLVTHVMLLRAQDVYPRIGPYITPQALVGVGTLLYFGAIVGVGFMGKGLAAL